MNDTTLTHPHWLVRIAIAIAILMTVGMLFYPAGYDQSVFQIGGQMVLGGKIPWRDFLDTKPPLVFYLFAAINTMLGLIDWSFRVIDVILQLYLNIML